MADLVAPLVFQQITHNGTFLDMKVQRNSKVAPVSENMQPVTTLPKGGYFIHGTQVVLFFAIGIWILSASFIGNIFNVGLPGQFDGYQPGGKTTIKESMRFAAKYGILMNCGLSYSDFISPALQADAQAAAREGRPLSGQTPNMHIECVYTSQPIFHRVIFSALYKVSGGEVDAFYGHLESAIGFLLAFVVTMFAWQIGREFGWGAAIAVVGLSMCSDWLVFVARSPYDVFFLKLMPFLATWILYPRVLDGRMRFPTLAIIVGALVFLNAASVYEFITSVILGAPVGVVYFGISRQQAWRKIVKHATIVTVSGVVAFLIVLSLHFVQVSLFRGSPREAWQRITEKIVARTLGPASTFKEDDRAPYHDSAPPNVSALTILHQYTLLKAVSIPFAGAEMRIYLTFFSFMMLSLPFYPFSLMDAGLLPIIGLYRKRLVALAVALAVSFAGTMVWPLIAKGRMFHHLHLDSILFYMSFMLVLYAALGAVITTVSRQAWNTLGRRWQSK